MWQDHAACKGHPEPDRFFPPLSRYTVPQDLRALCNACPVQRDCYEYAEERREIGIWAGLSVDERKDLRRREQRRVLRLREAAVA